MAPGGSVEQNLDMDLDLDWKVGVLFVHRTVVTCTGSQASTPGLNAHKCQNLF